MRWGNGLHPSTLCFASFVVQEMLSHQLLRLINCGAREALCSVHAVTTGPGDKGVQMQESGFNWAVF